MNRREALCVAVGAAAAGSSLAEDPPGVSANKLRAKWINLCADDFVVDVWMNGRVVPTSKRSLIHEIYGATVERIDLAVNAGDWLVFHVVHNRLRWNGCKFFGMAGMAAEGETSLTSNDGKEWCASDDPSEAAKFIRDRDFCKDRTVKIIPPEVTWDQGEPRLHELCGGKWHGRPIWGSTASCWLKLRVE
jgi:hypothetical protein